MAGVVLTLVLLVRPALPARADPASLRDVDWPTVLAWDPATLLAEGRSQLLPRHDPGDHLHAAGWPPPASGSGETSRAQPNRDRPELLRRAQP